ncbi:hypothetical protein BG006_000600 [Podila minutissima]|uniref:Secreted protein n=1 Tax=Podila minutissima TaxID=64525 RepID=A0A9P5SU95_9FUNG|nr:hypothetical protein BG006_000600 [Podila minutissima]
MAQLILNGYSHSSSVGGYQLSTMARFNTLVVLVLAVFLSVATAHSCYCVSCGSSICARVDSATVAVYSDGLGTWYESRQGCYHIRGIDAGDRAMFRALCTRHEAMGGICD